MGDRMNTPLRDLVTPGRHLALIGVTASGKSSAAMAIARALGDVELLSVDSMQVYRGMDIGTAKPTRAERAEVPHHMIDLVEPSEEFAVARFAVELRAALADVEARGKRGILVGGTGLYVRAAVDDLDVPGQYPDVRASLDADPDTVSMHRRLTDLDPDAAARMEPNNRRRVLRALEVTLGSGRPFSSYGPGLLDHPDTPIRLVGLRRPRTVIDARIEARYRQQMDDGFLDEVAGLDEHPGGWSRTSAQALGYRELRAHLHGEVTLEAALGLALVRTRQFARKQERWFRRDPRIEWIDVADDREAQGGGEAAVGVAAGDPAAAVIRAAGW
jgi:tRNA dimethylallyltransferase